MLRPDLNLWYNRCTWVRSEAGRILVFRYKKNAVAWSRGDDLMLACKCSDIRPCRFLLSARAFHLVTLKFVKLFWDLEGDENIGLNEIEKELMDISGEHIPFPVVFKSPAEYWSAEAVFVLE